MSQQQGAHDSLTIDHHEFDSQDAKNVTVEERLSQIEEMVAADTSIAAILNLEERVTRLEERLKEDLRVGSGRDNDPEEPGPVHGLNLAHSGSSQASDPKVSVGGIKEHHSIATATTAVALYAFFIALGQLLGQYYATPEGYRRCQTSVMGPWAKRTRLRWRWDQFRFETLFTTPQIFLTAFHVDQNQQRIATFLTDDSIEYISGSPESRIRTLSVPQDGEEKSSELACWLPLLGSLHENEWELQRYGCYYDQHLLSGYPNARGQLVGPVLRFKEMSWDSLPPGTERPFAVTTVSDIAIIVRRLGMSWEAFNPEGGNMRAQGNGHGIFSTSATSSGLVMQYTHLEGSVTFTDKSIFPNVSTLSKAELYIPTREADMMGFGILPGCDSLIVPYFKVGTTAEVYVTMDKLDSTHKASTQLRDVNRLLVGKWDAHCMYGFSDIIALAAPMIRRRHSTIVRVPMPTEYCSSLLSHKECFVVFHNRLKEYMGTRSDDMLLEQADWVLEQYERLKSRYSEWENEAENNNRVDGRDLNFLEDVHGCWDTATDYFVQLQQTHHLNYLDLMASHISHAVFYWGDAWKQLNQGKARDNFGLRGLEAEGSHLYFDYLPLIVEDMRRKGFEGPEKIVHEAWFTLMFRAFCWWRCHSLHPGEDQSYKGSTLPSRYWDSKLPVYIG